MDYAWPGNFRELQNIIERAVVSSHGSDLALSAEFFPAKVSDVRGSASSCASEHSLANGRAIQTSQAAAPESSKLPSLEEVERHHILTVLQKTCGLIEEPDGAARSLGLNPGTLLGRLRKLGISRIGRQIPWTLPRMCAATVKCGGVTGRDPATLWSPDSSAIQ